MHTTKTLSVIIPNFNKGIYIAQVLDSIINQTLLPNEIIVVDDCSTDNSKEVLESYEKCYPKLIHVFYLSENHGVQYARNYGYEKSTSEYVTFIDSDDFYYSKDKLLHEMRYAKPNKIVCSEFMFYDQKTKLFAKVRCSFLDRLEFAFAPLYCLINCKQIDMWPYAYIISKEAFNQVKGYDFDYNLYEDLDILIKLVLNKNTIKRLHSMGRAYRVNDSDTSHLSKARKEKHQSARKLIYLKYSVMIPNREKILFWIIERTKGLKHRFIHFFSNH